MRLKPLAKNKKVIFSLIASIIFGLSILLFGLLMLLSPNFFKVLKVINIDNSYFFSSTVEPLHKQFTSKGLIFWSTTFDGLSLTIIKPSIYLIVVMPILFGILVMIFNIFIFVNMTYGAKNNQIFQKFWYLRLFKISNVLNPLQWILGIVVIFLAVFSASPFLTGTFFTFTPSGLYYFLVIPFSYSHPETKNMNLDVLNSINNSIWLWINVGHKYISAVFEAMKEGKVSSLPLPLPFLVIFMPMLIFVFTLLNVIIGNSVAFTTKKSYAEAKQILVGDKKVWGKIYNKEDLKLRHLQKKQRVHYKKRENVGLTRMFEWMELNDIDKELNSLQKDLQSFKKSKKTSLSNEDIKNILKK